MTGSWSGMIGTLFASVVVATTACDGQRGLPTDADGAIRHVDAAEGVLGAIADPDCVWEKGDIFTVPVPVSETEVWIVDVEMKQALCLTRPDGSRLFKITNRVLSDIPLPTRNVTIHGTDSAGNPIPYAVVLDGEVLFTGSFPCGWITPDADPTFDWEFSLTPGGINRVSCRFPAP